MNSVESSAATRSPRRAPRGRDMMMFAVSSAALAAGLARLVSCPIALSVAVGLPAAVYGVRLLRLALTIHARQHTFGPCRGAGFLALEVLVTGVSVPLAAEWGAVALNGNNGTVLSPGRAASVAALGLATAILLGLLGLLLLPGAALTTVVRLRRALDGVCLGSCFLLTAWLMLMSPRSALSDLRLTVALLTCAGVAIAIVTGLRAVRYRPAALACCAGVVLSALGMAGCTMVFDGGASIGWLVAAVAALALGPALCWAGAQRAGAGPEPDSVFTAAPGLAGYPIMVVPVGAAVAAAGYHVATGRGFDRVSVILGLAVLASLAAREAFAVTDIRWYARRLAVQEAHFRSLVSGSSDVTVVLDTDLVVRWQSPAAARQFGLSDQEVIGASFTALVHPDDVAEVRQHLTAILAPDTDDGPSPLLSARLRDGFGQWRDTESTVNDQRGTPEVGAVVVHVRDIGTRRDLERTLHRMAFTDQLTGLANRRQLLRTLAGMHAVAGRPGALLMIDVNGFTAVNDAWGQDIGDAVLIEVARRLRYVSGEADLPARLSGDEFAIATPTDPVRAYTLANLVLTDLATPYDLPGAVVHLTASIGLVELADAEHVSDIVSRATLARRRARQLHPGGVEWYDEALEATLHRRAELAQELPGVIDRGELDVAYQPVIDLVEGTPVGVEALLCWRHPRLGTITSTDFLPVAEDLGMIDEIGSWLLHRACRQLSRWLRDGHQLWLGVALSARQIDTSQLVTEVTTVLDTHQVPADRLVCEVVERGLVSDPRGAVAALAGLRALGVRTALTQFGTGATPLAQLRRLPIDVLKVDRTLFTEPAGHTGPATPIIDVVVSLGRRFGMEIIAEDLESPTHLSVVRGAGCRYGQGALFGRPQPAERFEALLENYRSPIG